MRFDVVVRAVVRRWYLTVVVLGLVAAAGYAAVQVVPPAYSTSAEVLLLPPKSTVKTGDNPYLYLGGLTAAGDVTARALTDAQTAERIRALGGLAEYTAELDADSPAPLLRVTAKGSERNTAEGTLELVLRQLPATLLEVQRAAGVPTNAYITATTVTTQPKADLSVKPQLRALILAVGGSGVLGLSLIVAADGLLRRRRGRREGGDEGDADAPSSHGREQEVVSNDPVRHLDAADFSKPDAISNQAPTGDGPATSSRPAEFADAVQR